MVEPLRLVYLGGMQVSRGDRPVTGFVSAKAPAALCYLAVTGRVQFRLVLAGLLWGDLPEQDACANLRKVLSNLRDLVGEHLIITPHTVAFNRESAYWLDVEAFLERVDQETSRQIEAAELYQGDFLDGFYLRHAPAFEEWVLGQRERLRQAALQVFQALAGHFTDRGEYARAIEYTRRLLTLDPWREEAHRLMMRLLARSGQRSAALAQYEACRRLLRKELGVEPTDETVMLYRRIRAIGAPRRHNLPLPMTSFIGREAELAQVAAWLSQPECRLLTILGPGGVGKTRLALQAALQTKDQPDDAFLDGVFFISLQDVPSEAALATAIAATLQIPHVPSSELYAELLRHLRGRDMLLVLDGFEHLVGEARLLSSILQRAPGVKLLVTSRQRLNLAGEWVLELGGLPYAPLGSREGVEPSPAVQLFIRRARQARPDLALSPMDYQAITYICELVEGLPLAIELAAAWARSMSCLEIAQAVEAGAEALTAFAQDMPLRHRSLRASFEHSWKLLGPHEQQILRRLAVFRGGFTREAAEKVAGADLATLAALTDKSLLRRTAAGRYDLHAVLRRCVGEMLGQARGEREEVQARHVRYYLGEYMPQREAELRDGRQREAMDRLREEFGNLQAAWRRAAAGGMAGEINRALLPMALLLQMLGWWGEGDIIFGEAAEGLKASVPRPEEASREEKIALGAVLAIHGSFCVRTGNFAMARARLGESLAVLASFPPDTREAAYPYFGLRLLARDEGRLVEAEAHVRRALEIVRAAGDPLLTAFALDYLGEICAALGRPEEARRLLREALALHRAHGEQWGIGRVLYGLGQVAAGLGEHAEARQRLQESLEIFAALGARTAAARARCLLGEVALMTGEWTLARQLLEESLAVLEQSRDSLMASRCRAALARVADLSGQPSAA